MLQSLCPLIALSALFVASQDSIDKLSVGENSSSAVVTTNQSTTTLIPTTTTVVPTPTVPTYNATNGTDICLLMQMNVKLSIDYYNKQNIIVTKDFFLNTSSHYPTASFGVCDFNVERIHIQWWPYKVKGAEPSWDLEFSFKKDSSDTDERQFTMDSVSFNYTLTNDLFPETNETVSRFLVNKQSRFSAPIGSYYKCASRQTWKLTDVPDLTTNATHSDVYVSISNLRVEAFRSGSNGTFVGRMSECSSDYVPNTVVPIVIGVALGLMIIVALVTFIIGSRRRQAGYQEI